MSNSPNLTTGRVFTSKEKIYWSFASFGGALINGIYAVLLPIFYTDYLGLVEAAHLIGFQL